MALDVHGRGGVALLVMALINRKWKISAHGCGTGGLCGLVFYLMISGDSVDSIQWVFMLTVLVAGCGNLAPDSPPPYAMAGGGRLRPRIRGSILPGMGMHYVQYLILNSQ